jgi:hypothetical protein
MVTLMEDSKYFAVLERRVLEALRNEASCPPGRSPAQTDKPGFGASMSDKLQTATMPRSWASQEIWLARCSARPMRSAMTCSRCCLPLDSTRTKAPKMLLAATTQMMAGKVRMMRLMVRELCNLRGRKNFR